MFETIGEFAAASHLSPDEAAALQVIVSDPVLAAKARKLAEAAFAGEGSPDCGAEGGDWSRIRYAAAFFAAPKIPEHFAAYGFPESVMLETMTDLPVWLRNEMRNRGFYGLCVMAWPWQVALYQAKVTRHGRLECNTEYVYRREALLDAAGNVLLEPGDPVINLHIPEDGPMRIGDCLDSMRRMEKFFSAYRPDFPWRGFLCESWLLDRQLRSMLPENSNIVRFQDLGTHYLIHETDEPLFRIFGTSDPDAVNAPTSLQRNAAQFLRDGGRFMEEGIFIPKSVLN